MDVNPPRRRHDYPILGMKACCPARCQFLYELKWEVSLKLLAAPSVVSLFFSPTSLNEKQVHVVELSPEMHEPISMTGELTENRDLLPCRKFMRNTRLFISHCKLTSTVYFTAKFSNQNSEKGLFIRKLEHTMYGSSKGITIKCISSYFKATYNFKRLPS
ncbi:hypothetical protein AB3S75_037526 [Citrus x aurantiifolia]